MHRADEPVARRTRQRCTRRIDLLCWKRAATQEDRPSESFASGSAPMLPGTFQPQLGHAAQTDSFLAELGLLPSAQTRSDNEDDTTMPTWGGLHSNRFEYGTWDNKSSGSEDLPTARSLEIDSGNDSVASSKYSSYDLAAEWSAEVGYSSGSEADVESDIESHPELDDLLPMSPMSSRAVSPIREIDLDDIREIEPEVSPEDNITFCYV